MAAKKAAMEMNGPWAAGEYRLVISDLVRTLPDAGGRQKRGLQNRGEWSRLDAPCRTATPVANRDIWRHSAVLGEFRLPILNGLQRSVNRKVQGSSPCPGAKLRIQVTESGHT